MKSPENLSKDDLESNTRHMKQKAKENTNLKLISINVCAYISVILKLKNNYINFYKRST